MTDTPNQKRVYKAADVCETAHIPPYVLKSWEAEFPNLGMSRPGGSRVYRQSDVDQVLRIKRLVFDEGLTVAGARRRIESEDSPQPDLGFEDLLSPAVRESLVRVRQGLSELLAFLDARPGQAASAARGTSSVSVVADWPAAAVPGTAQEPAAPVVEPVPEGDVPVASVAAADTAVGPAPEDPAAGPDNGQSVAEPSPPEPPSRKTGRRKKGPGPALEAGRPIA